MSNEDDIETDPYWVKKHKLINKMLRDLNDRVRDETPDHRNRFYWITCPSSNTNAIDR